MTGEETQGGNERCRDSTDSGLEREDSSHLRSFSICFPSTAAWKWESRSEDKEAMGGRPDAVAGVAETARRGGGVVVATAAGVVGSAGEGGPGSLAQQRGISGKANL